MPKVRLPVLPPLFCAVMLAACGGSDAVSEAGSRPNSFPEGTNALEDFDTGSTGDSNNASGLASNELRVTVEVPRSVAPDGELTRRNLRIVEPDRLEVYQTDSSLRQLASVDITIRKEDSGRHIISFNDGLPVGPNIVIEASVGNTILRSLAADEDRDVKINPFSEYLVNNGLGSYTSSEFDQVMECVDSESESLCLNKYVWATVNDQVHDFEISIPDNYSVPMAVSMLANRPDFANYVARMTDYALIDSSSAGAITASAIDFNSVLLGIELGQSFREPSLNNPGQWGVRIAQEEVLQDVNGVAYVYPGLTLTNFDVFNVRVTSLASDVPYIRETLMQTNGNGFYKRGSDTWALNGHTTAPGAATLQDDLRLVTGRALYQSITGRDSSEVIGWTRNPFYLDAYVGGGDTPTEVLAGYFSAGKAIELIETGGELKRQDTLEDHYLSVFEVNLARSQDFALSTLDGKTYNVISFSMLLTGNNAAIPMSIASDVGSWSLADAGSPETALAVTESLTFQGLERVGSDGTIATTTGARLASGRALSLRPSQLSTGAQNTGRLDLSVGNGNTGTIIGASSPDGTLLAFNLNDVLDGNGPDDLGDGLIVAAEQSTSPAPDTGSYRLQGFAFGLETDSNRLMHFQDATLTLDSPISATLQLNGLEIQHTVSSQSVGKPASMADQLSLAYTDNGSGRIALTNGNLELTGFVTADQQTMFLRLVDNSAAEKVLGLVMATRLP
ncbi:hypothetical protein [Marinobacter zhejiangensis]|uniref:Uncharacterized protein n=1 Tax=Marinobacter zhejiangensis TaxID=488535 RepID=A0A1I4QN83_9GAMM|nr:hypothetical protein [Marinobacter zhejiangensis]SFM41578.1 hypothetical protein SAMN04487963_2486 [Marinobacter zhejiangensis]